MSRPLPLSTPGQRDSPPRVPLLMPLTREDLENDALRKQYENLRDQVPLLPATP